MTFEDTPSPEPASSFITFAFIGQLEEHKGIRFLLRAWSEWKQTDVRLIVAGKGSQESLVRAKVARDSRIMYVGYYDDIPSLLARVSFVIVPSLCYENAPLIILEGCAHGVPVVGARIGGIPEYIEDGISGFLFSPGDGQSLIGALERACSARHTYADLSRNARARVEDKTSERYCVALLGMAGM